MNDLPTSRVDLSLLSDLRSTDIYLIDQLLKGRLAEGCQVLDAGCGRGRNLPYFLRRGYRVFGVDSNPEALYELKAALLSDPLMAGLGDLEDHFRLESVGDMSFADQQFDFVISNAVLHFASNAVEFEGMLWEMWRVLRPGGVLFVRLATSTGLGDALVPVAEREPGWFHLPDGSQRFLVNEDIIASLSESLGALWLEPLKTTLVHHQRSMTTWVLGRANP